MEGIWIGMLIVMLAFVTLLVIVLIADAINPKRFVCPQNHLQDQKGFCGQCGAPVVPIVNPKCLNGHRMKEGDMHCRKCGCGLMIAAKTAEPGREIKEGK